MAYRLTYKGATVTGPGGVKLGAPTPTVTPVQLTASLRDISTTGSMSAGSNVLTVTDATGLEPGDSIAVLCDGASGAGVPGTRGPGGQWPTTYYETEAALLADVARPQNTFATALDTGLVYQWNPDWGAGGPYENNWYELQATDYHYYRMTPRALLTTIVEKSGTTLTLNHAAQVAVTNATVVFDNQVLLEEAISQVGTGGTLTIPAGEWPVCTAVNVRRHQVTITGEDPVLGVWPSKLTSPAGTPGVSIFGSSLSDDCHITKLELVGNCGDTGGWDFYRNTQSTTTKSTPSQLIAFSSADRMQVSYCRFVDWFSQAVQCQYGFESHWHHNELYRSTGFRAYTQWALNSVDSSYCIMEYNNLECEESIAAFEFFRDNDSIMRFNTTRNGLYSLNACGNYRHEDNYCLVEADSRGNSHVATFTALIVSLNVSPPASKYNDGGYVRRFEVDVEGLFDPLDTNLGRPRGINDSGTPKCRVEDALITFVPGFAGRGIQLTGTGASLTRCEVYGDDAGSFHTDFGANMYCLNGPAVDCTARSVPGGSTGGSIDAKATGSSGNVAEWITLR